MYGGKLLGVTQQRHNFLGGRSDGQSLKIMVKRRRGLAAQQYNKCHSHKRFWQAHSSLMTGPDTYHNLSPIPEMLVIG
ncbi:hypothetical protein GCM10007391_19650 [Alteromonas halophila]|uniref:Uncharacterized protein n=1 Tax=Alteromonas halophila TaxID=516698 RepID=A0A918JK85_9ALTE|nr:hypothetical protein GCM10007391_19650 [Alteromonas halophila]